jgi:phytanoyl-CoA dioxygenase PhyH
VTRAIRPAVNPVDAVHASNSLRTDGFAVVHGVFSPAELGAAEALLDGLFSNFDTLALHAGRRDFANDIAIARAKAGGRDQPEVLYPASFDPRLLETAVYRRCALFACALLGPVSRSFDHAIVKSPHNESVTPWHQDAAYINPWPRAFQMGRLHFWIPMQDVTEENGCMVFVAGSHKHPLRVHKAMKSVENKNVLATTAPAEGRRVACPVALGGFTIHTPRTLHFTGRNATSRPRKAWIIHFSRFGDAEIAVKRLMGRIPSAIAVT